MGVLRGMSWSVLAVGVSVLVGACGPAEEAPQANMSVEQSAGAGSFCGGFAGIRCDPGYTCVDDPSDDCNPGQGGADCGGICILNPTTCGHEPGYNYLFTDPKKCEGVRFKCRDGYEAFFNDCGCGCKPAV